MSLNFGLNSLLNPTDPARLHAELWGDYASKVVSCYLPIVMATVVVARDVFGSSMQCFPLDLARNATSLNITDSLPRTMFDNLGSYARQLAEFVNVYCETKEYFSGKSIFSYRLFALLLCMQAVILYTPILVWNITTARKIICNIRFIAHDIDMLYRCFRGEWLEERGKYAQKELYQVVKQWTESSGICKRYFCKQISSIIFTIIFICLFFLHDFIYITEIYSEFTCSVKGKFTVDCTVPSATIYRYVWGSNMALLFLNCLIIIYNILNILLEPHCAKEKPFEKLGLRADSDKGPKKEGADSDKGPKKEGADSDKGPKKVKFWANDRHVMYAFFQANVESIDKLNYVKVLRSCGVIVPAETTV